MMVVRLQQQAQNDGVSTTIFVGPSANDVTLAGTLTMPTEQSRRFWGTFMLGTTFVKDDFIVEWEEA